MQKKVCNWLWISEQYELKGISYIFLMNIKTFKL